jgi:hypothetical protein
VHTHTHPARTGDRVGDVTQLQDVGPAGTCDHDRTHTNQRKKRRESSAARMMASAIRI